MGRRAIGLVRVSEVAGREGESFVSPSEQKSRIVAACEREGLQLLTVHEEIDVKGGTPLADRDGLRTAVEAVEGGQADVVMVAYFDRLVRSLRVQDEVVSRVEGAGGRVVALDFGEVTGKTAAQWLSGTMIGAVSEYYRRSAGERNRAAQARAVARGVVPWASIPVGYVRGPDGTLALETTGDRVWAVRRAFELRANQAPVREIRQFLRDHGIVKSFHGTQSMFRDRLYIGEIHFGKLVNFQAHEPLIDRDLFERVQRVVVPRGPRAHSDRLLARLGVLRCGTCGSRMVVATGGHGRYWVYRCPPTGDCERRMAIAAPIAERVLTDRVREELANIEGRASADREAHQAALRAERAQADLDAAIRVFVGLSDEPAARERLADLRRIRDVAREEAHRLSHLSSALTIRPGTDWDSLTVSEQRDFIRAVVERAEVFPGKGAGRIRVTLR